MQGWLALAGGLVAVAAFVVSLHESAKRHASAIFVVATHTPHGDPPRPGEFTRFVFHNDSDLPALDVTVSAWAFGRRRRLWRLCRPDKWLGSKRLGSWHYPTVPPHTSTKEEQLKPPPVTPKRGGSTRPPLVITFRDGTGRRWVRWPDGRLQRRVPHRPLPRRRGTLSGAYAPERTGAEDSAPGDRTAPG